MLQAICCATVSGTNDRMCHRADKWKLQARTTVETSLLCLLKLTDLRVRSHRWIGRLGCSGLLDQLQRMLDHQKCCGIISWCRLAEERRATDNWQCSMQSCHIQRGKGQGRCLAILQITGNHTIHRVVICLLSRISGYVPYFFLFVLCPGLELPRTQNVPYFNQSMNNYMVIKQ